MIIKLLEILDLSHQLYIDNSKIHGKGLFTKIDIPKNTKIILAADFNETNTDNIVTYLGSYINHINDANCNVKMENNLAYLMANQDISKNTELTVNYKTLPNIFDKNIDGFKYKINELQIIDLNITYEKIYNKFKWGKYGSSPDEIQLNSKHDIKQLCIKGKSDLYNINVKNNPYKLGKYYVESKVKLNFFTDNRPSIKKIKSILDILEIPYESCYVYSGYKILEIFNRYKFTSIVCYYKNKPIMFSEILVMMNTFWKIYTENDILKLKDIDFNNSLLKQQSKLYFSNFNLTLDLENNQIIVQQNNNDNKSYLKFDLVKGPHIHYYGNNNPHTLIRINNVRGNVDGILSNGENISIPINYTDSSEYGDFWDLNDGRTSFRINGEIQRYIDKINKKITKSITSNSYSKSDIENILKLNTLSELQIKIPPKISESWIRKNIKEIIKESGLRDYLNPNSKNINIFEYNEGDDNGYLIDDGRENECEGIYITENLERIKDNEYMEGPGTLFYKINIKGINILVQGTGC